MRESILDYISQILWPIIVIIFMYADTASLEAQPYGDKTRNYANDIQLHKSKHLNLTYQGKPLIVEETIGSIGDPALFAQHYVETEKNGSRVLNLYRIGATDVDFRREAALSSDGILELTVRAEYKLLKPKEPLYLLYSFAVPVEYFNDCNWKIRCGMDGGYDYAEGRFSDIILDGEVFVQKYIRFLALEKSGFNLVIDFNPYGAGTFAPYTGAGDPAEMPYSIAKRDNKIIFSFFKRNHPEFFGAKVQIYSGRYNFDDRHPYTTWDYIPGPRDKKPTIYTMGADQADLNTRNFGLANYQSNIGMGWLIKPKNLQLFGQRENNIFKQGLLAEHGGKGELVIDTHSGLYFLTVTCGHPMKNIGPFTLKVNGETVAENVKVKAGSVRQIDASIYLRAPQKQLKLSITGKNAWAINNFTFQTYMYQNEDFSIDRGYWLDDKLPELMPGNNNRPVKTKRSILSTNVMPEMQLESGKISTTHKSAPEVLPPNRAPGTDWIWNMKMVEFNGETALNRQDKSVLRQRLIDEVIDLGLNTLNEMSLFWYNSHSERWNAHTQIQKDITKTAHELGIKVVRHMDGPVVLKRGSGPRFLVDHIGLLNRDIITGLPAMSGFCINNPKFKKMLFDQLAKYVMDTNVDGVMIDECYFRPINYCGCVYCRNKFEADTGYALPLDSASKVMFNQQDPIWLRWITWRYQASGDFYVALRKKLNTVRPNVIVMGYDNEIDHMDGTRVDISMAERELARGCDMVGTEAVISNIYANYRSHYTFRKITSAINESYNRAGWGLFALNPGNKDMLFISWAIQQMNRQGEWNSGANGDKANTEGLRWLDAMPAKDTKILADIAILYSTDLRYPDTSTSSSTMNFNDIAGFSQIMTDAHIPHVFLLKRDLQPEKLKRYKVLILASAESLGLDEIAAVKEYVKNGGTLIISGAAATVDNNYWPYKDNPLSEITGLVSISAKPEIVGDLTVMMNDGASAVLAGHAWRITPDANAEVLGKLLSANQVADPAIIINRFGKGLCFTSAVPLGKFNCEPFFYTGQTWTFQKNDQLAEVLVELVDQASGRKYPVIAANIPEGVVVETYKNKTTRDTYVHFLNMTSSDKHELGKAVSAGSNAKVSFPRLDADFLVIDIAGSYTTGYAVSPDFAGHREIRINHIEAGHTRIILSKEDLNRYTLLVLKSK